LEDQSAAPAESPAKLQNHAGSRFFRFRFRPEQALIHGQGPRKGRRRSYICSLRWEADHPLCFPAKASGQAALLFGYSCQPASSPIQIHPALIHKQFGGQGTNGIAGGNAPEDPKAIKGAGPLTAGRLSAGTSRARKAKLQTIIIVKGWYNSWLLSKKLKK